MTGKEVARWAEKTGSVHLRDHYTNRIEYAFYAMPDGWIAVFERTFGCYDPLIQAKDEAHAESYCALREPAIVPMQQVV